MKGTSTPGPWSFQMPAKPNAGQINILSGDRHIADIFPFGRAPSRHDLTLEEAVANARLIAAAPKLLSALEAVISAAEMNNESRLEQEIKDARAIIAEVRGETP